MLTAYLKVILQDPFSINQITPDGKYRIVTGQIEYICRKGVHEIIGLVKHCKLLREFRDQNPGVSMIIENFDRIRLPADNLIIEASHMGISLSSSFSFPEQPHLMKMLSVCFCDFPHLFLTVSLD